MALSKIYQQRLEQLHEDVDRSIKKRLKCFTPDFPEPLEPHTLQLYTCFIKNSNLLCVESKIELLTKLEEL